MANNKILTVVPVGVEGVKGAAEESYRKGYVNITPQDIGFNIVILDEPSGTLGTTALNTLKNNPYIEEVIRKKMEVNAKKYGFFRVIQTSSSDTLLEFWDLKQRYCYKVLISYYCMTPFSQNRNAALKHNIEKLKKPYQADMILQFSFFEEQPETIFSCIKENLYIDKILPNELRIIVKKILFVQHQITFFCSHIFH